MPKYSFCCSKKKCNHNFDEICSFRDFDNNFVGLKCPKCGKKKPDRVFTINSVGVVGNLAKMNNFQYAGEKNFEKAQQESSSAREEAKKKGIVSPYADLPDFTDNGRRMNFVE